MTIFSSMGNMPQQFRYSFDKSLFQNSIGVIDLLLKLIKDY